MKRLNLILVFILCGFFTFSQQPQLDLFLTMKDNRWSTNNGIPYSRLYDKLKEELKSRNFNIVDRAATGSPVKPVIIEVMVDFLNFYESAAKNMYGKGMLVVNVKCTDIYEMNEKVNLSVDIPFQSTKLRNINNPRYRSDFTVLENEVQDQLFKRFMEKIDPLIENIFYYADFSKVEEGETVTAGGTRSPATTTSVVRSDVDIDVPETNLSFDDKYAVIIGNEDYSSYQLDLSSEVNVDFAAHDAERFNEYAVKTLGIPERNIILIINGTSGQMHQALAKINLIIKNSGGKADVIFYYAGHGMPDEVTKEAYIMPVDVSAKNLSSALKITDVYRNLTEYPNKRVTAFLDACFSGGARNQGLLAARAVKVKPKEDPLTGKLVVFTASSGEESSLPYRDKNHGMFTYFLLKKIQETKGDISYKELSDYIREKVALESVLVNSKEQNTQTNVSPQALDTWQNWNLLR